MFAARCSDSRQSGTVRWAKRLLRNLDEARKQESAEADGAASSARTEPWMASVADSKRLNLASQLLRSGEIERALQFADPALLRGEFGQHLLSVGASSKERDCRDERFARLLSVVAQDSATDANTVSGLSS